MALSEQEEFELLSMERERAAAGIAPKPRRRLEDYGPTWGQGVGKLIDKFAYGAGGKVTDLATSAGASPEVAAGAGYAANVASQAIPALLGGGPAKAAGAPLMESAAKTVMQSALKPTSKSLANGDAAKAIQTILDEGLNVTAAGAAKLRILITNLKGEVGRLISQSPAEVNRGYAYKELATLLEDVAKKGAGYTADKAAIMKAWNEFKNHPLLDKFAEVGDMIPIQIADKIKRATQQAVKDSYGRLTSTPASDKSQMAIASGLRQGMEAAEPRVAAMNAKLSEYINALHQLEPRAAIAANRDLGGLAPIASSPEAAMLMLADRNPWLKSYIARILYAGREQIPATAARAGIGAYEAATQNQQ